jgi:hypothetical protein
VEPHQVVGELPCFLKFHRYNPPLPLLTTRASAQLCQRMLSRSILIAWTRSNAQRKCQNGVARPEARRWA